jgi:hypothetical protein
MTFRIASPARRSAGALVLLLSPATATAQPSPLPPAPAAMSAIREADLRRDLFAMAADSMRGREGGTIDEMKASMWLAEQYRKIGLVPMGEGGTWFQSLDGRALELWRDIVPYGVVPVEATGPVLWLADPSDSTVDVRGRVVAATLVTPPPASVRATSYPTPIRYAEAAVNATLARLSRRGASAILLVASPAVDSVFGGVGVQRARGSYDVDRATPRARGGSDRIGPVPTGGAGQSPAFLVPAAMAERLRQSPTFTASIRLERFETMSVNVIGGIRGTDPALRDEYLLYSSHQDANGTRALGPGDSVLAGADDNASVTVAELAVARAMMAQKPRRSVLFINHGAEERGLLGSRYHSAHPVVPMSQVVTVLNGDMIGRNHPDTAALLGSQPPHRGSKELVDMALAANTRTGKFVIDTLWDRPSHPEGWFFRSDHLPYARLGVPTLMYTTNLHPDYHTADDVPERIDYPKLLRMTRWMYLTGWYVANVPKRPAVDAGWQLER